MKIIAGPLLLLFMLPYVYADGDTYTSEKKCFSISKPKLKDDEKSRGEVWKFVDGKDIVWTKLASPNAKSEEGGKKNEDETITVMIENEEKAKEARLGILFILIRAFDLNSKEHGAAVDISKVIDYEISGFKEHRKDIKINGKEKEKDFKPKDITHKGTREKAKELIMTGFDEEGNSNYRRIIILKSDKAKFTYVMEVISLASPDKKYEKDIEYIIDSFKVITPKK